MYLIVSSMIGGARLKLNIFLKKRGGSTVYCELQEKIQSCHFSISNRL